jgi:hypothetical protein
MTEPGSLPGVRVVGEPGQPGEEAAAEAAPSGPTRTPRRLGRPVRMVLAAVGVAGVVGSVVFGLAWAHVQGRLDDQAAAKVVASQFLFDLTNFDAHTVAADFRNIAALAAPPFSGQARQVFTTKIRGELQAAEATTRGHIAYLEEQSYQGSSASYYAEVDQTYANDQSTAVQHDQLRVVLGMKKVGGTWKISTVTTLGSGAALGG